MCSRYANAVDFASAFELAHPSNIYTVIHRTCSYNWKTSLPYVARLHNTHHTYCQPQSHEKKVFLSDVMDRILHTQNMQRKQHFNMMTFAILRTVLLTLHPAGAKKRILTSRAEHNSPMRRKTNNGICVDIHIRRCTVCVLYIIFAFRLECRDV